MPKIKSLKVLELFAGVGGFRLGLEGYDGGKSSTSGYVRKLKNTLPFEVIYSNQWEPATTKQHASILYKEKFGDSDKHFNCNITSLKAKDLPIGCDVLTAGFPCPDFSVASLLKNSKGLKGSKGKLWKEIRRLITELKEAKKQPDYLILENVDRMLKSPVKKRGNDFKIILKHLEELNYNLEWRVINAADYGFPQRRRRVFIFCYRKGSKVNQILKNFLPEEIIQNKGVISLSLKSKIRMSNSNKKQNFLKTNSGPYKNAGVMINGVVYHYDVDAVYRGRFSCIKDILYKKHVPTEYYIEDSQLHKWTEAKGAKRKLKEKDGFKYYWSEGKIDFPDSTNKPSRTIITSEGGKSASRIKHVVKDKGRLRRLMPLEVERLNMFPDDFTLDDAKSISDTKRVFLMGNALVVGVVEKIGNTLSNYLSDN